MTQTKRILVFVLVLVLCIGLTVKVKEARVAISEEMARRIMV